MRIPTKTTAPKTAIILNASVFINNSLAAMKNCLQLIWPKDVKIGSKGDQRTVN